MKSELNQSTVVEEHVMFSARRFIPPFFINYKVPSILFFILLVFTIIWVPEFFNLQNMINVARQASITGIVAIGMTFVVLTSGIDLSVGSTLAIVGVSFAMLIQRGVPIWATILIVLIIGIVMGLINGVGSTFFGIQPFIMTLAVMAMGAGFALLLSNGTPQSFVLESNLLVFLGNGSFLGIPGPVWIFVIASIVAGTILKYLPFGRFVYGIGGSLEAARLSGVKTTRVLILVYVISGACAAIAGIITTSRLYVGHPTAGGFIMLDSIAAVVIGGTSLMGGRGSVAGTVAGVCLLAMVANLLNLIGVSPFNQQIAKGLIIIIAVLFTTPGLKDRIKQQWSSL
ncbi:ABC transporter permease [Paenibacillus sp. sgz302251]|uniref:ABC transporter permease n=1 Tax=Paenibacillus sp. sgz302251 TaxID=3414493 RepID=UPI003C7E9869